MSRYAENTRVSAEQSRSEIEKILTKYGANGFMYGWQQESALIAFEMKGRRIKFILPFPKKTDREFTHTQKYNTRRTEKQAFGEWEKACRQRWRALSLCIKAKLEAVESKITTFEEEFLAHIMLANGDTVGGWIAPQLDQSYKENKMPNMLTGRVE